MIGVDVNAINITENRTVQAIAKKNKCSICTCRNLPYLRGKKLHRNLVSR
jgi:hypothetical protein